MERYSCGEFDCWASAITRRGPFAMANGCAERLIGSVRRECLDHVVVLRERHLRHTLGCYADYYNNVRTHLSLAKDAPRRRAVQAAGRIEARPILGRLHHQYVQI
jgi:transposase InsO family protein